MRRARGGGLLHGAAAAAGPHILLQAEAELATALTMRPAEAAVQRACRNGGRDEVEVTWWENHLFSTVRAASGLKLLLLLYCISQFINTTSQRFGHTFSCILFFFQLSTVQIDTEEIKYSGANLLIPA